MTSVYIYIYTHTNVKCNFFLYKNKNSKNYILRNQINIAIKHPQHKIWMKNFYDCIPLSEY